MNFIDFKAPRRGEASEVYQLKFNVTINSSCLWSAVEKLHYIACLINVNVNRRCKKII